MRSRAPLPNRMAVPSSGPALAPKGFVPLLRHHCPLLVDPLSVGLLVGYVGSGAAQALLVDWVNLTGGFGGARTLLSLIPLYAGMALCILFNWSSRRQGTVNPWHIGALCLFDCAGEGACFTGLVLAGSSIFTVRRGGCARAGWMAGGGAGGTGACWCAGRAAGTQCGCLRLVSPA